MVMTAERGRVRGYGVPLDPAASLALLVARLRDASHLAERLSLQRELQRIADELVTIRKAIMETLPVPEPPGDRWGNPSRDARGETKNPGPGTRRCSKCRTVLPIGMFAVSDRRTGKLRADCKVCYNQGQRARYVRAGFKVVTVEVLDGDPCVGHLCPVCEKPFEVGQHVQGENVRHEGCRP